MSPSSAGHPIRSIHLIHPTRLLPRLFFVTALVLSVCVGSASNHHRHHHHRHHHHVPEHDLQSSARQCVYQIQPIADAAVRLLHDPTSDRAPTARGRALRLSAGMHARYDRLHNVCSGASSKARWETHTLFHEVCALFRSRAYVDLCEGPFAVGGPEQCLCAGLPTIQAACDAGVRPWSHDDPSCASVPSQCAELHPLSHVCRMHTHRRDASAARAHGHRHARARRLGLPAPPKQPTAIGGHASWTHRRQVRSGDDYRNRANARHDAARAQVPDFLNPHKNPLIRESIERSKTHKNPLPHGERDRLRRSADWQSLHGPEHGPDLPSSIVAFLVEPAAADRMIRERTRHLAMSPHTRDTVCAAEDEPVLRDTLAHLFPNATVVALASVSHNPAARGRSVLAALRSQRCVAFADWETAAERTALALDRDLRVLLKKRVHYHATHAHYAADAFHAYRADRHRQCKDWASHPYPHTRAHFRKFCEQRERQIARHTT